MAQKKKKRTTYQAPKAAAKPAPKKAAAQAEATGNTGGNAGGDAAGAAPVKGRPAPKGRPTGPAPASRRARGGRVSARASWWILGGAIAAVVLGVIIVATLLSQGGSGVTEAQAWDLPARAVETDNGDDDGRIMLSDFRGRPVVINFFAGWCDACDAELPFFAELGERYSDQVDFVFVHANEGDGGWREMAERHNLVGTFPIAEDVAGTNRNGLLRELGGAEGMPATATYNAAGQLIDVELGQISEARLVSMLNKIGVQT